LAIDIYTVHVAPAADGAFPAHRQAEAVFVREGFSWPAFFFQPLWALYHRLWFVALLLLAALVLVGLVGEALGLSGQAASLLNLVAALFIGAEANDWRRNAAIRRGYEIRGIVAGETLEDAERRYFDSVTGAL